MLVSWGWDEPVKCAEHGLLTNEPLETHDAGIVALKHLRDVHGMSAESADGAIAKVEAHQAQT
jgi:hypothetical protein